MKPTDRRCYRARPNYGTARVLANSLSLFGQVPAVEIPDIIALNDLNVTMNLIVPVVHGS